MVFYRGASKVNYFSKSEKEVKQENTKIDILNISPSNDGTGPTVYDRNLDINDP